MKVSNAMQKAQVMITCGESEKSNITGSYSGIPVSRADDPVNISRLINKVNQMITSKVMPQPANDKVHIIKSSIDSGTYSVSGLAVAAKMLGYDDHV